LKARVRQQAVLRRLRELGDFTRRGVQRQLAREFGVSASVMCRDVKRLLARLDARPAQVGRVPRSREVHMPEKVSLRLSTRFYDDLQHTAHLRHTTLSALIRAALQQLLGQEAPTRTPAALPADDPWERLLARCPDDVQQAIRQTIAGTGLPLGEVLRALVIAACQPNPMPPPTHECT
jgi:hypothetical protein